MFELVRQMDKNLPITIAVQVLFSIPRWPSRCRWNAYGIAVRVHPPFRKQ